MARSTVGGSPFPPITDYGFLSDCEVSALLAPSGHPASVPGLRIEAEVDEVPWHVRLHDRSTVGYAVHLAVARKEAAGALTTTDPLPPAPRA